MGYWLPLHYFLKLMILPSWPHQKPCRNICLGILHSLHNVTHRLYSINSLMNLRQSCNSLVTKTDYGEASLPIVPVEKYIMKLRKTHNFGYHYKIWLQRPHSSNINIATKEREHEEGYIRETKIGRGRLIGFICSFYVHAAFKIRGREKSGGRGWVIPTAVHASLNLFRKSSHRVCWTR